MLEKRQNEVTRRRNELLSDGSSSLVFHREEELKLVEIFSYCI